MATRRPSVTINSAFGGIAPSQYYIQEGQYLAGIGIDPQWPISDSVGDRFISGSLRPTAYAEFSGANITGNPYWILNNPKNANTYVYANDGKVVSYDSAFGTETLVGTPTSGAGNGAAYYNNYLYFATPTNVSRYGPLDGSPSLTNTYWTSTLSLTALVNTTYPSIRGSGVIPNHAMHVHVDNKLYICDYDSTSSTAATRGRGLIHALATTYGSAEGDTNNSSSYNALDLPLGYMPVDIESYGNYVVIAAIQSTNATVIQGKAALFFWDGINASFYNVVHLPDPLVTALINKNGELYVFSGSVSTGTDSSNGYRVSKYLGGQSLETVYYSDVGSPPLAGAVDAQGDRLIWGTFTQINSTTAGSPEYYPVVMALGTKSPAVPGGIHCIAKASGTGTAGDGIVTAVKQIEQASMASPRVIIGWRDSSGYGVDKSTTTYATSVWRSRMFNVGKKFAIRMIRIPLGTAVGANMTITPKIFLDDFSSSSTSGLTVINNTNYANSERTVQMHPDISGNNSFCLELRFSGTALLPVKFPIVIEFDVLED